MGKEESLTERDAMTKVEQAELLELGLTEAQIEQRAQEISTKLRGGFTGKDGLIDLEQLRANAKEDVARHIDAMQKPTRKRRSDAGKPKAKKAEAVPGVLSQEQAQEIHSLAVDWIEAAANVRTATITLARAGMAFDAYLDSLKGTA